MLFLNRTDGIENPYWERKIGVEMSLELKLKENRVYILFFVVITSPKNRNSWVRRESGIFSCLEKGEKEKDLENKNSSGINGIGQWPNFRDGIQFRLELKLLFRVLKALIVIYGSTEPRKPIPNTNHFENKGETKSIV